MLYLGYLALLIILCLSFSFVGTVNVLRFRFFAVLFTNQYNKSTLNTFHTFTQWLYKFHYAHFTISFYWLTVFRIWFYRSVGSPILEKKASNSPQCSLLFHNDLGCSVMFPNVPDGSRTFYNIPEYFAI